MSPLASRPLTSPSKLHALCAVPLLALLGCGGEVIIKRTRTGKTFYGCNRYPECDFTSWDLPTDHACVKCGTFTVLKKTKAGRSFLLCTNAECKHIMNPPRKSAAGATAGSDEGDEAASREVAS